MLPQTHFSKETINVMFIKKGFKITIFATIPGINHRQGETFKIKAGYTIFPNGQLKCNTLWGGEWK